MDTGLLVLAKNAATPIAFLHKGVTGTGGWVAEEGQVVCVHCPQGPKCLGADSKSSLLCQGSAGPPKAGNRCLTSSCVVSLPWGSEELLGCLSL